MAKAKRAGASGSSDRASVERHKSAGSMITRAHKASQDAFKALARARGCHDAAACRAIWSEAKGLLDESARHLASARRLQTAE